MKTFVSYKIVFKFNKKIRTKRLTVKIIFLKVRWEAVVLFYRGTKLI